MGFQATGQNNLDRRMHVWVRLPSKEFKCVLCGGISRTPGNETVPSRFERLTAEERALCPPSKGCKKRGG